MLENSISIICATIDDSNLIVKFINSIEAALHRSDIVWFCELILIDQSDLNREDELFRNAKNIDFKYVTSNVRGLSLNRNKALRVAAAKWVMCCDADCELDVNFFNVLSHSISNRPDFNIFFGKILSIEDNKEIFRKWPRNDLIVSDFYKFALSTSVNIVWRQTDHFSFYDERFGLGAKFGSCEDIDFVIHLKGKAIFINGLIVRHPDQSIASVNIDKAISYSYGFGALCRKNALPFGMLIFMLSLFKKLIDTIAGKSPSSYLVPIFLARARGFFEYD